LKKSKRSPQHASAGKRQVGKRRALGGRGGLTTPRPSEFADRADDSDWWKTALTSIERQNVHWRDVSNAYLRDLAAERRQKLRVLPSSLISGGIVYHPADLYRLMDLGFLLSDLCACTLVHLAYLSSREGWLEINDTRRLSPKELRDLRKRMRPDADLRAELLPDRRDLKTPLAARRVLEEFFEAIAGPRRRKPKPNRDPEIATRVLLHMAEGKSYGKAIEAVRAEMGKTPPDVESAYKRAHSRERKGPNPAV
jgi:hypothetical protein